MLDKKSLKTDWRWDFGVEKEVYNIVGQDLFDSPAGYYWWEDPSLILYEEIANYMYYWGKNG